MELKYEDALLLKSIEIAMNENKSNVDFRAIFQTYDWLNKSVLTLDEFKESLEKLINLKLVRIENENLTLTDIFISRMKKLNEMNNFSAISDVNEILNLLKVMKFEVSTREGIDENLMNKIKNARFEYLEND